MSHKIIESRDVYINRDNVSIKTGLIPKCEASVTTLIEWTAGLGSKILDDLINGHVEYPYRNCNIPLKEPYYSVFRGFFCSLDGYLESDNPVLTGSEIISGTCMNGPKYAKFLKNLRRKSLITTWNSTLVEPNEELDEIPSIPIKDIGDIFNYQYLPNWKIPDEDIDDYRYGMEPCHIDQEHIDIFYNKAVELLNKVTSYKKVEPDEILLSTSGSKSLMENSEKTEFLYLNNHYPQFSKRCRRMKRSLINSQPNVMRDSVILEPNDLNTVKFIDLQLRYILEELPSHIHLSNPDKIQSRLKKFSDKYSFFFMRDIKKEGITKPKPLIKMMIKALYEFTGNEIFSCDFFLDYELIISKTETITPIRGHGLGMGNALTTFMQIILFSIIIDECEYLESDVDMLCLNDDFVAGFIESNDLEEFKDKERLVMNNYSILTEYNKSFSNSNFFVLAEEYNGDLNRKESYWRSSVLRLLACNNIVEAKSLANSLIGAKQSPYFEIYKKELISYWGYEFFKEEIQYPTICGGWISNKLGGVSLDIIELEALPYNQSVLSAYMACKHNTLKMFYKTKKSYRSLFRKLHPSFNIEGYEDYFDVFSIDKAIQKYHRTSDENRSQLWSKLQKKRQKVYRQNISTPLDFNSFIEEIINNNASIDYFPSERMIKKLIPYVDVERISIRDIYISRNPKSALLAKLNCEYRTDEIGEDFSIEYTEIDLSTKGLSNSIREKLKNSILPNVRDQLISHDYGIPKFKDSSDEEEFLKSYINPFRIFNISNLFYLHEVPVLKERYRSSLIEKKINIYNRIFTIDQQKYFSKLKISRKAIKHILKLYENYNHIDLIEFCELMASYLEETNFIENTEDKEEQPLDHEVYKTFMSDYINSFNERLYGEPWENYDPPWTYDEYIEPIFWIWVEIKQQIFGAERTQFESEELQKNNMRLKLNEYFDLIMNNNHPLGNFIIDEIEKDYSQLNVVSSSNDFYNLDSISDQEIEEENEPYGIDFD